jgi:hypothetical protein
MTAGRLAAARARRWGGRARAGVTLGGASYPLPRRDGGAFRLRRTAGRSGSRCGSEVGGARGR